jgi:hypothetical protein
VIRVYAFVATLTMKRRPTPAIFRSSGPDTPGGDGPENISLYWARCHAGRGHTLKAVTNSRVTGLSQHNFWLYTIKILSRLLFASEAKSTERTTSQLKASVGEGCDKLGNTKAFSWHWEINPLLGPPVTKYSRKTSAPHQRQCKRDLRFGEELFVNRK